MYVRMSANSAPYGDASVEAEALMVYHDEEKNLPILAALIDEAANKLRRMYGIEAK